MPSEGGSTKLVQVWMFPQREACSACGRGTDSAALSGTGVRLCSLFRVFIRTNAVGQAGCEAREEVNLPGARDEGLKCGIPWVLRGNVPESESELES
jgi:hypothetical protein